MVMKLNFTKVGILALLVGILTPTVVMALAHSDLFTCDGCHTPHNAEALPGLPLWNGTETIVTFTMYSSDSFQGAIDGQPSGDSKQCLSCHDGANPDYSWMNPEFLFEANELVNSHPISFVYDSALATLDGALKDPSESSTIGGTILEDLLDPESKVQCSSCHDVHTSGVGDKLLRGYDYGIQHGSELCRMCHMK
ncbi:MAG: cytochrome c3 family protein [Planctomycetota bacterium]|jgi:predicted CXXCH cytochrome family protein